MEKAEETEFRHESPLFLWKVDISIFLDGIAIIEIHAQLLEVGCHTIVIKLKLLLNECWTKEYVPGKCKTKFLLASLSTREISNYQPQKKRIPNCLAQLNESFD